MDGLTWDGPPQRGQRDLIIPLSVFGDPAWTIQRFNWDTDVVACRIARQQYVNALNPDLQPFISRGGKLIQYHGWADPQIAPANTTDYYNRVVERLAVEVEYTATIDVYGAGDGHCARRRGTEHFDMVIALERWVEAGLAPDSIIATISRSTANLDQSRPLCPHPEVAVYDGTGSTDDAANFACRLEK